MEHTKSSTRRTTLTMVLVRITLAVLAVLACCGERGSAQTTGEVTGENVLSLHLSPRPISLVDRALLNFTGGESKAGMPPHTADLGLQDPRHRVGVYGDLSVIFVFGELDGNWTLYYAKSADGETRLDADDFTKASKITPLGPDGANGRVAYIDLALENGRTLSTEVRVLFGPGLVLHRSMMLHVGELQTGGKKTLIGLIHNASGSDFDDLRLLKILIDRDGDGRFSEDESVRPLMPIQVEEKYLLLKSVTPDGTKAELVWFESDVAFAPGFLMPEAEFLSLEGEEIELSSKHEKWRMINVWATYCAPCVTEIPMLTKLAEEFKDRKDVEFLAVSPGPADQLKKFLEKHPFGYRIAWSDAPGSPLFAQGFPWHVIVDPAGRIRHMEFGGTATQDHLSGVLRELLGPRQ